MQKIYKHLLTLSFLFFTYNLLHAQVGVYDATFGTGGKVFRIFNDVDADPAAVALQADGKIIVGGTGGDISTGRYKIVRFNDNGTTDATFGINGVFTFVVPTSDDLLQSLIVQPDGKILGAGIISTYDAVTQQTHGDFHVFRLKENGTFDSTFGTNGRTITDLDALSNDVLHEIILKPDGKIVAGGQGMDMNTGDNLYGLVQYNADGTIDNTFGANGKTVFILDQQDGGKGSLGLLSTGQIVAATTMLNPTTFFYEFGLIRFTANGLLDTGFGNGGFAQYGLSYFHSIVRDMAIQRDDKIVLTGNTDQNNRSVIAVVRVDANGVYDPGFGENGVVRTHISEGTFTPDAGATVSIQRDQKIIVGGTLDNAINSYEANFAIVRYLANGGVDLDFGRQGIIITDFNEYGDFARASLIQPDGKFVIAGYAESASLEVGFGVARFVADARYNYNTLKGSVFYDNNGNGIKDAGENFFQNAVVAAEKAGIDTIRIASSTGVFTSEIDTGIYTIRPVQPGIVPYFIASPPSRTIGHSNYFNTDSVSFAMRPIPGMRDLFVYIVPLGPPRPGFPVDYMIVYGNNGTDSVFAGSIEYVRSPLVTITSTQPAPLSTNGDTMRWNYVNLYPRDTGFIIVHGNVLPPPAVNIGDTLTSYAFIFPTGFDQQPKDNSFKLKEVVVGSYDPNDKTENHAGVLTQDEFTAGDYLQYVIRFQNTGTDTAFNVYVRDTLQNTLDWSTLQMVAASHPYKLVMDDGVCLWSFNNIALVDSTQDEPNSHGYVVYRIKPKQGLVAGNQITNRAGIYFDYNLPVITNTEVTTIVSTPVPVKLLSFSAKKLDKTNRLQWRTTNEINADRFEVERSANGIEFKFIGTVGAKSTFSSVSDYDFADALPLTSRNYYRLKIVDKDGRFEYSPVRLLSDNGSDYYTLYPNPVRNVLLVKIENEKKDALQAQVLTYDGRVVYTTMWNVDQGSVIKSINTSALPKGTYLLKVITSEPDTTPVVLMFEKL